METILNVEGMKCGNCTKRVKKALSELDGVSSVEVSLEDKKAKVEFDDKVCSVSDLRKAVEDTGFHCVD